MSNFKKHIQKIVKSSTNCLAVNVSQNELTTLIETFDCVFVLDHQNEPYRHKSLIYRESYDSLASIPDIKLIMCHERELINMTKFLPIISKSKPVFCLLQGGLVSIENTRELNSAGYHTLYRRKHFQFWGHRGKSKK